MEQNGITRKQARIQMISPVINIFLGAFWVYMGLDSGNMVYWIIGAVFIAISIAWIISIIVRRKRYPIEDPEADKEMVEGLKSGGVALLLIAAGFLAAIGLVLILT